MSLNRPQEISFLVELWEIDPAKGAETRVGSGRVCAVRVDSGSYVKRIPKRRRLNFVFCFVG